MESCQILEEYLFLRLKNRYWLKGFCFPLFGIVLQLVFHRCFKGFKMINTRIICSTFSLHNCLDKICSFDLTWFNRPWCLRIHLLGGFFYQSQSLFRHLSFSAMTRQHRPFNFVQISNNMFSSYGDPLTLRNKITF